jgi:hypothetical protein
VLCRVLQVNLGKNCGAKSAVEKCGRGTQKKSYPSKTDKFKKAQGT